MKNFSTVPIAIDKQKRDIPPFSSLVDSSGLFCINFLNIWEI